MALNEAQSTRYARHLLLAEVGARGQERLLAASVELPGGGRADEEAAIYLAAGGLGRLVLTPTLADRLRGWLAAVGPDTEVATEGHADRRLVDLRPDERLVGARAALALLVELAGAASPSPIDDEHATIRWELA